MLLDDYTLTRLMNSIVGLSPDGKEVLQFLYDMPNYTIVVYYFISFKNFIQVLINNEIKNEDIVKWFNVYSQRNVLKFCKLLLDIEYNNSYENQYLVKQLNCKNTKR